MVQNDEARVLWQRRRYVYRLFWKYVKVSEFLKRTNFISLAAAVCVGDVRLFPREV